MESRQASTAMCTVGVVLGEGVRRYSFSGGHPLGAKRMELFEELIRGQEDLVNQLWILQPTMAESKVLLSFHSESYVEYVRKASETGFGLLDYGDTPAFPGVFEASAQVVGSTLLCLQAVMDGKVRHAFNPAGGLHHARRDRAGGFCVFNDAAVAISHALAIHDLDRILYVDIDAHHGDGVYYGFSDDPRVFIVDIHEDGSSLYPGTGAASETGSGLGTGTKVNIPLPAGSGDTELLAAISIVEDFAKAVRPQLIILQCGADGIQGDPLTHLNYSLGAHSQCVKRMHELGHRWCKGRIVALGGGGYHVQHTAEAWVGAVEALLGGL